MKKFIVESLQVHHIIHIVEAENEEEALSISEVADDNWQEYLGQLKVDVSEYSEERIRPFKEKEYFCDGAVYRDKNGDLQYRKG